MSFSSETKSELCEERIEKKCCALAECYGILLYCNTFTSKEIRIITANDAFAKRLPSLFRRAFGLNFDESPSKQEKGKCSIRICEERKIRKIMESFGADAATYLSHHVNFGMLEEECCRAAFVRGAFLAGGSVTDPEKRYHLELATAHQSVSREMYSLLLDMGFTPKETSRSGNAVLYFKKADTIADFFTLLGACSAAMKIMTAKVEKEMRNTITRQINCDSANADKTVSAAQAQLRAIRYVAREQGLDSLPDVLRDAAYLRITNPEASLSDLASLAIPPVSKSCLNHRLKKIMSYMPEKLEDLT